MAKRVEEIKACLDALNSTISMEEKRQEELPWEPTGFDKAYMVTLYARRRHLETELASAEADGADTLSPGSNKFAERDASELRKPRGKCVTIDGWDV